jgi:ribosome-associated protein
MLKTVIEEIDEALSNKKVQPLHREGKPESGWLLLDCGAVVAHAFLPEARLFYDLERMWADAPRLKIPKK